MPDTDYLDGLDAFYPDDTDWGELESAEHQEREAAWLDYIGGGPDDH